MTYIDERKSRLAGQLAAADAIAEYADRMHARDVARMLNRVEHTQRARRTGKAVH